MQALKVEFNVIDGKSCFVCCEYPRSRPFDGTSTAVLVCVGTDVATLNLRSTGGSKAKFNKSEMPQLDVAGQTRKAHSSCNGVGTWASLHYQSQWMLQDGFFFFPSLPGSALQKTRLIERRLEGE
jgi:hypothetical protein